MKKRALRTSFTIFASILTLLLLACGAGVGYTWYVGQQPGKISAPVVAASRKPLHPSPSASHPAADAAVGASVQSLISPAAPGEETSLTVRTQPGADCSIKVMYDKLPSSDSRLQPAAADAFGMVSWSWKVEGAAPEGKWPVKVNCKKGDKSAVVQADLVVKLSARGD